MKRETSQAPSVAVNLLMPRAARKLDGRPGESVSNLSRLGFLSQLCLSAKDVERALQEACRFSSLWSDHDFSLHHERERLVVRARVEPRAEDAPDDQAAELVLLWFHLVERVAGVATLPESVRAPSADCPRLRELLGCKVTASVDEIAVCLYAADALRENPNADERLFRVLLQHAEERQLDHVHMQTVSERLHRTLLQLEDSADSRAEALASRLGLGVRTLHRRLRAEGTSYRKVLTNFQMRRCIERLESPSASAKQLAFALGFSDPASFYRAFKRWTGHTVSEYRLLRGSCGAERLLLNDERDSERA